MIYKLGQEHLETFRLSVLKYITLYGVTGWQLEFALGKISGGMASVAFNQRRVDITLALKWNEEPTGERLDAKAKHEVFHILVARFSVLASKRHVSADELYEAEEELVERLLYITSGS